MGSHGQAIWEEARRRVEFTAREIADATDRPWIVVCEELGALSSYGCVECLDGAGVNQLRADTRWRLAHDIGPMAPRDFTMHIPYDPNSGRIMADEAALFSQLRGHPEIAPPVGLPELPPGVFSPTGTGQPSREGGPGCPGRF